MQNINEMKQIAADKIVEAVQFANVLGVAASDSGVKFSGSLLLNIRDAMFHFRTMCDYCENDEEKSRKHYYSLMEHLVRGEKDAVILYGKTVVDAVMDIMQKQAFSDVFSQEDIRRLRHYIHAIKGVFLKLRKSGMHLLGKSGQTIEDAWAEIVEYTEKILEICRKVNVSLF